MLVLPLQLRPPQKMHSGIQSYSSPLNRRFEELPAKTRRKNVGPSRPRQEGVSIRRNMLAIIIAIRVSTLRNVGKLMPDADRAELAGQLPPK